MTATGAPDIEGKTRKPRGKLSIRVLAMPADTNQNGDIFGGWLLGQMDIAGSSRARHRAGGRVVTAAVDAMSFHRPVCVGDEVSCYAEISRTGRTSITVRVEAYRRSQDDLQRQQVTEGLFTYVRIDKHGRPQPLDPE